jgi:excisionase family DNA binding protein
MSPTPEPVRLPLADARKRGVVSRDGQRCLDRPPGRPKRVLEAAGSTGTGVQSAPREPAIHAGAHSDFAATLPPRGLPLKAAASYSGVPVRSLWRLIAEGRLVPVRVPGVRRVLLLREEIDALLEAGRG